MTDNPTPRPLVGSLSANLIAYCDARIEKLLIARDKAKDAGRVGVERCRQSDIETLLEVREVVLAETARLASEPPVGTREPDAWIHEYRDALGRWKRNQVDLFHPRDTRPPSDKYRWVPVYRAQEEP